MTPDEATAVLLEPCGFGPVTLHLEFGFEIPPASEHANIRLVPFSGDEVVISRCEEFGWMLPGGTLEAGERWLEAAARELREEAGCRLLAAVPFAWMRGHTSEPTPWRDHLPHPDFVHLIAVAEVAVEDHPEPVAGGEHIVEVRSLPVEDAVTLLVEAGEHRAAALVAVGATVRANTCAAATRGQRAATPVHRAVA